MTKKRITGILMSRQAFEAMRGVLIGTPPRVAGGLSIDVDGKRVLTIVVGSHIDDHVEVAYEEALITKPKRGKAA